MKLPDGFEVVGIIIPKQADMLLEKRLPICDLLIMKTIDDETVTKVLASKKEEINKGIESSKTKIKNRQNVHSLNSDTSKLNETEG